MPNSLCIRIQLLTGVEALHWPHALLCEYRGEVNLVYEALANAHLLGRSSFLHRQSTSKEADKFGFSTVIENEVRFQP